MMPSDEILFAGLDISSGRKPMTLASLNEDLTVKLLERWDQPATLACLSGWDKVTVVMNIPSGQRGQSLFVAFKSGLLQAGFQPFSPADGARQWLETKTQDCFQVLSGHQLFPRRTLEGRLQRTAILYEQGLQVIDPVDLFEEFTRYKLIRGILPLDDLPASRELDALAAAYLAWMSVNRAGQVRLEGPYVLPPAPG